MSSVPLNSKDLKAQALRLGFVACGLAPAEPVQEWYARQFLQWVQRGMYADMDYMQRHIDMRLQPTLLHPGVKTIISVALNYMPSNQQPGISLYAQGKDYHDVMRQRLLSLMQDCKDTVSLIPPPYWNATGHGAQALESFAGIT